jgi:nucleotide-binding universal stress UspA family protein
MAGDGMTSPAPERVDVVLVPLDGSEFSQRALPVARSLAFRLDAALHLFSAVPTEDDVTERKAWLDSIESPGLRVDRTVVVNLDVAGAIHEELRRSGGAVACIASHGRGRSAALVGSVTTEVVARGHDPLVVVGPRVESEPDSDEVVACVDETPQSAALIPIALRWAELLGDRAAVITVAEPVPPPMSAGPPRRRFGPDEDVDLYLRWMTAPLRAKGADLETRAVYDPISPAEGLRRYLRDHPAALAVVGSKAKTGLRRVVFGSTSAEIIHKGSAPVLVVPFTLLPVTT